MLTNTLAMLAQIAERPDRTIGTKLNALRIAAVNRVNRSCRSACRCVYRFIHFTLLRLARTMAA